MTQQELEAKIAEIKQEFAEKKRGMHRGYLHDMQILDEKIKALHRGKAERQAGLTEGLALLKANKKKAIDKINEEYLHNRPERQPREVESDQFFEAVRTIRAFLNQEGNDAIIAKYGRDHVVEIQFKPKDQMQND